jgi:iron complex transport system substrate-binding protein
MTEGDAMNVRGRFRRVAIIVFGAASAIAGGANVTAAELVDDAGRRVELPDAPSRVFAAGAPAEILLYTLVPEMLVGRNHTPSPAAAALMPEQFRALPQIVNLPDRDDARYDAELVALKPDVYVDYGTVDDDYVAALEAVSARTKVPGAILDGTLAGIPDVYRRLGAALGVAERGTRIADGVERLLTKYRNRLDGSTRVYIACSGDGLTPCYEGHSGGEAAKWLGAVNVAGALATAPRRPWTIDEIRAASPDAIVVFDAARVRADAAWRSIPAVVAGRVYSPPAVPFGWGSRPPSVNRLPGLVWLAYVLPGRDLDAEFVADISLLFTELYHVDLGANEIRGIVER